MPTPPPTRRRRARAALLGASLLLGMPLSASCNSGGAGSTAATTSVAPRSTVVTPSTTLPTPVGEPVDLLSLDTGTCFNRYSFVQANQNVEVTTKVPCTGPHQSEVYLKTNYPAPAGTPYPDPRVLAKYAQKACYDQFAAYIGAPYEVSVLDIGVVVPPKEFFEDSRRRYRGITCYVTRSDRQPLGGPAAGSKL